jgi:hypothetical protein
MDTAGQPGAHGTSNLQQRVVGILTRPAQEWATIAAEPRDIAGLYRGYIVPLAAIPPVCALIGMALIGISLPYVGRVRIGFGSGLVAAIVQYILALVGAYVAAIVIAKLAPNFESEPDTAQALKLVAYSSTPAWLAGVFSLIPVLSPLAIVGLYGIYLIYVGVTPVMKTPLAKRIPYLVVSALAVIVVYIVIGVISWLITPGTPLARGIY